MFYEFALLLAAAGVLGLLAHWLKQPLIVAFIAVGIVVGPAGLRKELDSATGWYQLTYQVDRPPDGEAHELQLFVRRPGVEVKTTRLVTAATTEGQAEARVRRLLGGAVEQGDLAVDLAVGPAGEAEGKNLSAEVSATVHFGSLAPLMRPGARLRVSVAVAPPGGEPKVEHRGEELREAASGWIYAFPAQWPAATGARLAVTVEAIASGSWGSAVVDLPAAQ